MTSATLVPAVDTAAGTKADTATHLVRRYVPAQQVIHWIGVISFFMLLFTGVVLLFTLLSFLAKGGTSGVIHRIGAIAFILLPALYLLRMPRKALDLVRESFTYDREEWEWFKHMPGYFLGSTRNLPPQGRLNAGQKLHHAATFLMFNTVTLSGLIMWFAKGQLGPDGLSWGDTATVLHTKARILVNCVHRYAKWSCRQYARFPDLFHGWPAMQRRRLDPDRP